MVWRSRPAREAFVGGDDHRVARREPVLDDHVNRRMRILPDPLVKATSGAAVNTSASRPDTLTPLWNVPLLRDLTASAEGLTAIDVRTGTSPSTT